MIALILIESILRPLVDKAFRRPATELQLEKYTSITLEHIADGHRFEDGIHLALRALLCSPNFLYRHQKANSMIMISLPGSSF